MQNDEYTPDLEQEENETQEVETQEETTEEVEEAEGDTTDWKAEALKSKAILARLKNKKQSKPTQKTKSDGFDYGEKAFLAANGVKGSKELEFFQAELTESGQDIDTLLENSYFKARLDEFRSLNQTAEATIAGKRSGGAATDSVDYWMAKPIEEVPKEMRAKVVNAKLQKDKSTGVFYNS
jgi:hypothetical protein